MFINIFEHSEAPLSRTISELPALINILYHSDRLAPFYL
jgi:hypothetical protein